MPLLPYHIAGKPGRLSRCLHIARDCIPQIVLPKPLFNDHTNLLQIIILSPHSGPRVFPYIFYSLFSPGSQTWPIFTRYHRGSPVTEVRKQQQHVHLQMYFKSQSTSSWAVAQTIRSRCLLAKYLRVNGWDCPQSWVLFPSWRISSVAHGHLSFS